MVKKTDKIWCVAILAALAGFASGCAVPQKIGDSGIVVEQREAIIEESITDVCGCEGKELSGTRLLISSLSPLVCPGEWRIWPDDRTNERLAYLYEKFRADDSVVMFMYHLQGNAPISTTRRRIAATTARIELAALLEQAILTEFSELTSQLDAEEYGRLMETLVTTQPARARSTSMRLAAEIHAGRVIYDSNTEHIWAGLFYARVPQISDPNSSGQRK